MPVRIALDAKQLQSNPLRVGLSMDAEVDVSNQSGKTLADAPRAAPVASTQAFSSIETGAEAEVRRVIAANAGRSHSALASTQSSGKSADGRTVANAANGSTTH